jgi:hypothetical protein
MNLRNLRITLAVAYALYNIVLVMALENNKFHYIRNITLAHFVFGGVFAAIQASTSQANPIKQRYENFKTFRGVTLAVVDVFIFVAFVLSIKLKTDRGFGIAWAMALFSNIVCLIDQNFTLKLKTKF